MKNFIHLTLFCSFLLFACNDNGEDVLTDDERVDLIAFADNKVEIQPSSLRANTIDFIETNHFETYIRAAFEVLERGFEVRLGDEEILYFDRNGENIRPLRNPFSDSPCGRSEFIRINQLPTTVTDYIAENYPDANAVRAKKKVDGPYFVKIDQPLILIFNDAGEFIEATTLFFHCRALGEPIDISTISTSIIDFINEQYPNNTVLVAFEKTNGTLILGISTDEGRKILGFNANGELIFQRP